MRRFFRAVAFCCVWAGPATAQQIQPPDLQPNPYLDAYQPYARPYSGPGPSDSRSWPPRPDYQQPYPYGDPQSSVSDIINRSLGSIDEHYCGAHCYFNDDVVGRSLQAAGPRVCEAWRSAPPDFPLTGNFSLGGIEFSLDKACGIKH